MYKRVEMSVNTD